MRSNSIKHVQIRIDIASRTAKKSGAFDQISRCKSFSRKQLFWNAILFGRVLATWLPGKLKIREEKNSYFVNSMGIFVTPRAVLRWVRLVKYGLMKLWMKQISRILREIRGKNWRAHRMVKSTFLSLNNCFCILWRSVLNWISDHRWRLNSFLERIRRRRTRLRCNNLS